MKYQGDTSAASFLTLSLEVISETPEDSDPSVINKIGRDTIDALRDYGYTFEPVYTGQRGGFIIDVISPAFTALWTNKDVILADVSALVTIFTPVFFVAKHIRDAYERHTRRDSAQRSPIKIVAEIDGASLTIEAPDLDSAEAAFKLAHSFQTNYPTVAERVTKQSKIKVTGRVPKRQSRKRR